MWCDRRVRSSFYLSDKCIKEQKPRVCRLIQLVAHDFVLSTYNRMKREGKSESERECKEGTV